MLAEYISCCTTINWLQAICQTRDAHGAAGNAAAGAMGGDGVRDKPGPEPAASATGTAVRTAGLIGGDGVRDNPGSEARMRALIRSMTSTRCGRRAGSACHMSSTKVVTLTGHST